MAKNPAFLQEEIDIRNTNKATVSLIMIKTLKLSAKSVNDETYHRADHRRFTRKNSRPRWDRTVPFELGTLKTVENAHNTADMK